MTEFTPVRIATLDDEDAVMDLCRLLHEENGLFDMKDDCVRALLRRAFILDRAMLGVIEETGKVVACVLLTVETIWYSDECRFLQEIFNFVHAGHRTSNYAKSLIDFAKHSSDELGIPLLIGVLSNKRTEAKVRLYKRQLEPCGAFFLHNRHLAKHGAVDIG